MVAIVDASAERWDDLAELMGQRGDPSHCWCQYYRQDRAYDHGDRESNRAAMHRQVTTATVPHGVLAYDQGRPVGWCAVAPRADYPRLSRTRAASGTVDEPGLWSVSCFVVRVGHRRRGVAARLLDAAVDLARRHGARIVEAYPIDTTVRPASSATLFQGPLSLYLRTGFAEIARPSEHRAIVRRTLNP
ncbi:GNAT family N-acetyltransferase [Rugosimonospora acidiphila]|uniref:GNAT family N-acetyltransferase n=1 Tax=Rugosimonospora acidiphila TaxID=556531 RepID=A0ABP9S468_9ACTN